ncbi:MAG: class I SAM-dependent rRNA methyltransferase [Cytophagales bacterium]|nr:MAG: class I SAM-dependent rRNA methyltransferase [Cytophagales bacterium]
MQYPILVLKPKRERSLYHRHPWLFSGAVHQSPNAEDGQIVEIRSYEQQVLGYGFFAPKNQIVCRMFHFSSSAEDFYHGDYWFAKIKNAFQLRKEVLKGSHTNAYRLLHAEGDFIPGIIADVYNEVVVVQIMVRGIELIASQIFEAISRLGFNYIFVKSKNSTGVLEDVRASSYWATKPCEVPVEIIENGQKFLVDFIDGQKTGFFLDQRDNRMALMNDAKGKIVLNAFSYTGGFSVYALAGGASEVYSLDISEKAVELSHTNAALNGSEDRHYKIVKDCFEYLKDIPKDFFDIIVLDPPAFAKHSRAVANATRGYKQINLKAIQNIKSGGLIYTFSCSQNISQELFQKIIFGAAADARRNVRIIKQLHQPCDHPINIFHPEGEYLKGLVLWVE